MKKSNPLVSILNLKLTGVPIRLRMISLLVLSVELEYLKHSMNYVGGGSWQAFRDDVKAGRRPTWEQFVIDNSGITPECQAMYIGIWPVVKGKLLASGDDLANTLAEKRPSDLTASERALLIERIGEALTAKDTFTGLRIQAKKLRPTAQPDPDPPSSRSPTITDLLFQNEALKNIIAGTGVSPGNAGSVADMILLCHRVHAKSQAVKHFKLMGPPAPGSPDSLEFPKK